MSPYNRDEEEGRLRADLIQEERELRPLRDKISEAERSFDLQLEALDRKSEVQDISHVINFHNQTIENIRKELENLSTALEENEQRLREAVDEAKRLNLSIEEAKEKVEGDRMISMAPLYDNLYHVKTELRLERNAGAQESRQASLAMNKTIDNARSRVRDPSGSVSNIEKVVPNDGSHSGHKTFSMEQVDERYFYTQKTSASNTRPFTRPSIACNDVIQNDSQQVTAAIGNRLNWPEKGNFIYRENRHSRSAEQTRFAVVEPEAGLGVVYGPPKTRESSATCSSFTTLGTSPMDPYTDARSRLLSEENTGELVRDSILFTISDGLFTSPDCMKGVPVAKIEEGGTYWVDSWTKLNDWHPKVDNNSGREASVTFFKVCKIHPNQLLAKKYYDGGGLCQGKYPIIIRRILQILECARIEDPCQWLRYRLAQLIASHEKDGSSGVFQLKSTLISFQKSDPVYQQYYKENRYKSIDFGSISKKGLATRFGTSPVQSDLSNKRSQSNASPLSTERPGKLPRRGSFGSRNVSDVLDEDRMITARSRNRDSSKMPPLLSPLLLDPAYENAIQTNVSAARIKREGSKAITSGGDVLFDLYFINCGKKEYGEDAPSLKFDAASGDILPLHPISGDLSAKFPELVIRAPSLDQVMFATGKEVGDIVKLKYKVGEGSKTQLGFRNADDAVLFVTFLSTYNKKLKLCEEDSKRIAEHGFF